MAQNEEKIDKARSLHSIKLEDFPENQELSSNYQDRDFEDEIDEDTVFVSSKRVGEDNVSVGGVNYKSKESLFGKEKEPDNVTPSSVSRIFDEDIPDAGTSGSGRGTSKGSSGSRSSSKSGGSSSAAHRKSPATRKAVNAKEKQTKSTKKENVKNIGVPKHRSLTVRLVKFFIFLFLWIGVAFACYKGYEFAYKVFKDTAVDSSNVTKIEITVTGDETDKEMGELLLENGLIDDLTVYRVRCKLYDADYVAGTYKLSPSYTTEKIINILSGYTYSDGTIEEETTGEETTE